MQLVFFNCLLFVLALSWIRCVHLMCSHLFISFGKQKFELHDLRLILDLNKYTLSMQNHHTLWENCVGFCYNLYLSLANLKYVGCLDQGLGNESPLGLNGHSLKKGCHHLDLHIHHLVTSPWLLREIDSRNYCHRNLVGNSLLSRTRILFRKTLIF